MDTLTKTVFYSSTPKTSVESTEKEAHLKFFIRKLSEKPNCTGYPETLPAMWDVDLKCIRALSKKNVIGFQFNLHRSNNQKCSVEVDFNLKILNYELKTVVEHSLYSVFTATLYHGYFTFCMWLNNKLLLSVPNDELGVEVDMKMRDVLPSSYSFCNPWQITSEEHSRKTLQANLKQGFGNKSFTDLTIKTCDGTVPVHRFILCCKSTVFEKMFLQGIAEIEMSNLTKTQLETFLKYLYTGTIDNITVDTAIVLYETAVEYEVQSLQTMCAEFLVSNITLENACQIWKLADQYNDSCLKQIYVSSVCDNVSQ